MTFLKDCTVHNTLFIATIVIVLMASALAAAALKGRIEQRTWVVRLAYPLYLFRSDLFENDSQWLRYSAIIFMVVGLVLLILTALPALASVMEGSSGFCGYSF